MLTFECPHCGERYEVDDALAGKTIRCRGCEDFARVLAPEPSAQPDPLPAPTLARPADEFEPWYYRYIVKYAEWGAVAGLVIAGLLLVVLPGYGALRGADTGTIVLLFVGGLAAALVCVLSGLFASAFLLLVVDIGRSLRRMRPPDR
jgi:predicted Zn finger-like uncharacterized protein